MPSADDEASRESATTYGVFWRKSSFSQVNGHCVEVAGLPGKVVGVRDSKNPGGHVLRFTAAEWGAFLPGVHDGDSERDA
jgi:hypothetical protein